MNKILRLAVTSKCNRKCSYCLMEQSDIFKTFEKKSVTDLILNSNIKQYTDILITGGEPLLHFKKLLYLIDNIKMFDQDVKFWLFTNGDLLSTYSINLYHNYFNGITIGLHDKYIRGDHLTKMYHHNTRLFRLNTHDDVKSGEFQKYCEHFEIPYRVLEMNEPCKTQGEDRILVEL